MNRDKKSLKQKDYWADNVSNYWQQCPCAGEASSVQPFSVSSCCRQHFLPAGCSAHPHRPNSTLGHAVILNPPLCSSRSSSLSHSATNETKRSQLFCYGEYITINYFDLAVRDAVKQLGTIWSQALPASYGYSTPSSSNTLLTCTTAPICSIITSTPNNGLYTLMGKPVHLILL